MDWPEAFEDTNSAIGPSGDRQEVPLLAPLKGDKVWMLCPGKRLPENWWPLETQEPWEVGVRRKHEESWAGCVLSPGSCREYQIRLGR